MLGVRSNFLTADENQANTIGDLQQRIEMLSSLIQKKNTLIHELKLKIEENHKTIDHLALKADTAEKTLQAEEQSQRSTIKKMKERYKRFKEKHQQLQEEQQLQSSAEIEKHKDQIKNLQSTALRYELENIHLTMSIQHLAQLARKEIQTLKLQLKASKKLFLQNQQTVMQELTSELSKIIQAEAAYKNQIQALAKRLLDKNAKLRVLKPATRQLLLDQQKNQELIKELQTAVQSEHALVERQNAQLKQVTTLQQKTALALQEKTEETLEAYLENAYLKHQVQELQNEKNQADRRLLSGWKKWLWGGLGTGTATLMGLILGALIFTTTLWNPVGWTLLALGACISGYCFYEAKTMHKLAETVKKQTSLSTTAQLAFPLGGEEGLRVTATPAQAPSKLAPPSASALIQSRQEQERTYETPVVQAYRH